MNSSSSERYEREARLFKDMLDERARNGAEPFPCADLITAYFEALGAGKLKIEDAPESFRNFVLVLVYAAEIAEFGLGRYLSKADEEKISCLRSALELMDSGRESLRFLVNAVHVERITRGAGCSIEPQQVEAAHEELDELEQRFKDGEKQRLEELLASYVELNEKNLQRSF